MKVLSARFVVTAFVFSRGRGFIRIVSVRVIGEAIPYAGWRRA
jgi:hypothetical protein